MKIHIFARVERTVNDEKHDRHHNLVLARQHI